MKKAVVASVIILTIGVFAGICYWFYPRFYSPTYEFITNIPIEGQSYVTSKLIASDGSVYWEEKDVDPSKYRFSRQIGRTKDGFRVIGIRGDKEHNEIMLTELMFPQIIYKKE